MEERENKKPLIITITIAIILLIILGIQMKIPKSNKIIFDMNKDFCTVVEMVVERNNDWTKLPLSKDFRKKYNSKSGVFPDDDFDKVGSYPIDSSKEEQIVALSIGHGRRYDEYYVHYDLNENNELDDVKLIKTVVEQYDVGLKPTIMREPEYSYINDKNFAREIAYLSSPDTINSLSDYSYQYVETTENFKRKYSDGFGNESEFDYVDGVTYIEKLSSWDDRVVNVCKMGVSKEGEEHYEKYYNVYFTLDDMNRVDEIQVVDVPNAEIRRLCDTDK